MDLNTLASLALGEQHEDQPGAGTQTVHSSLLEMRTEERDCPEGSPSLPPPKRQKVDEDSNHFVRRPCTTARASRKPKNPRSGSSQAVGATAPQVKFGLEGLPKQDPDVSIIQKLVRHALVQQERKARRRAQRRLRRLEATRAKLLAQYEVQQDLPVSFRPGKRSAASTPPLLACIKREAAAAQHPEEEEEAALLEASKGLLCMKTAPVSRENRTKSLNALHQAGDHDMEGYCPAPGLGAVRKSKWDWAYNATIPNEDVPHWGTRLKRGPDVYQAGRHPNQLLPKDKEAKLQRQEILLKEKEKTITGMSTQFKIERKQLHDRIDELEQELRKRQQSEQGHGDELEQYKAEAQSQRDTIRNLHTKLVQMQEEVIEVHRHKANKEHLLEEVQQELARSRLDIQAGKAYRQDLLNAQAEAAQQLQQQAQKHAAVVHALERTNKQYAHKIETLLLKVAEMADQVHEAAALKERSNTMRNVLSAITAKAEQLRTSGKPADLDTFHILRSMVVESMAASEDSAAGGRDLGNGNRKLIDLLTQGGVKEGTDAGACQLDSALAGLSEQKRLDLLEKENELLVARCKQQSEKVRDLEQQLAAALSKSSTPALPWKARVAGGTAGDYQTFAMRTSAQVELPEGTLLSVPRSANMQSSSNALLSLFHEGDILNFLHIDINTLSPADREAAGRLLLEMNMSQLTQGELSMLLRQLGKANLAGARNADVQYLATRLLNVLGIHGAMALLEDMVNKGTGMSDPPPGPGPPPPQESDEALTYFSSARQNTAASPLHTMTPIQTPSVPNTRREPHPSPVLEVELPHHAKLANSHQSAFLGPSMRSEVDLAKLPSHQSGLNHVAAHRPYSLFGARMRDPSNRPQNGATGGSVLSSSPSSAAGANPSRPSSSHMLGHASRSKFADPLASSGLNPSSSKALGKKGQQTQVAPSSTAHRLSSSLAASRGGSPSLNSVPRSSLSSIPLEQLNSLAQLRSLPASVLQGLTQQLVGRGGGGRKLQ